MKWLFRLMALLLLLTVVLVTPLHHGERSGWIVFSSNRDGNSAIYLMSGDGALVRQLAPGYICPNVPTWSPGGRWISFITQCANTSALQIYRADGTYVRHLPYTSKYEWAPDSTRLIAREVVSDYNIDWVITAADGSWEQFFSNEDVNMQWSPDGEWIYAIPISREGTDTGELKRIHVTSRKTESLLAARFISQLSWSPDGTQIALVVSSEESSELSLMTPDGSDLTPVPGIPPTWHLRLPRWSPDGKWIAFESYVSYDVRSLYRVRPNGNDLQHLAYVHGAPSPLQHYEWSSDSEWLLFATDYGNGSYVYRLRADGSAMENLGQGASPHYATASGRSWHPLWLTIVALGALMLSMIGRLRR